MSAATIIADAFGEGACLYKDVLEVDRDATQAQLRKAYYRKALVFHPDKSTGNTETKFQAVNVAYEILKDPEKRAEYDETGELYEGDDEISTEAWKDYFSHVFGKITTSDIDKFAAKYKCSSQEEEDVLKEYKKFKGNLTKMLDCVMLSEPRDTERWVEDYIRPAIEKGDVENYSKTLEKTLKQAMAKVEDEVAVEEEDVFDEEETESDESEEPVKQTKKKKTAKKAKPTKAKAKKKSKQQREAEAAEELMAKIQGKNSVAKRKAGFDAMFKNIQERYGVTEDDPLAGQDFEAIQAEMLSNKKKRAKK